VVEEVGALGDEPERSPPTAAMTVSTASSPSFFAALSMPARNSFAVQELASPDRARSATIFSRSDSEKPAHERRL
jgi:hypothetical protein